MMDATPISNEQDVDTLAWMARTGLTEETLSAAVEALIYVSEKPMSLNKIRDAIDAEIPLKTVHAAIEKLQREYESKHHGLRLQEVALGYQFRTKATYAKLVQDYLKVSIQALTPATLETLAIVCYQQPISKSQIDLVRGVDSSHLIKTLIDKKLITVSGRAEEEPGRPSLYVTTTEFLEFFNLNNITDLPKYAELEELASLDVLKTVPAIKEVLENSSTSTFDFDDLVEIDEIAGKIKQIQTDTDFTAKLKNPIQEIITPALEEGQEPIKTTIHRTAFDILEEFTHKVDDSMAMPVKEAAGLKEVTERELELLLDEAFEKLTDLEARSESVRQEFQNQDKDLDGQNKH